MVKHRFYQSHIPQIGLSGCIKIRTAVVRRLPFPLLDQILPYFMPVNSIVMLTKCYHNRRLAPRHSTAIAIALFIYISSGIECATSYSPNSITSQQLY